MSRATFFEAKGVRARPRKTHCIHGHERTPDNVDPKGNCLTCRRTQWKTSTAARSAARAAARAERAAREGAQHAHNVAEYDAFVRARRARGIPEEGTAA